MNILLRALEQLKKNVVYYALDLSLVELQRTLSAVPNRTYQHVKCFGLHGTYADGLEWLKRPEIAAQSKSILSLGSSIGNFKRHEAAAFLRELAGILQAGDTMLIGIDACKDSEKVFHAYNDKDGLTHQFILNGLLHANRLIGTDCFKVEDWKVIGGYDSLAGRHHAFVSPLKDVTIDDVHVREGERIRIEESYKWSQEGTARLWEAAGLVEGGKWSNGLGDYGQYSIVASRSSL